MKWSWSYFFIKLTSRKFWIALAAFLSSLYLVFYSDSSTAIQITGVCSMVGTVISYLYFNLAEEKANLPQPASFEEFLAAIQGLIDAIATIVKK